MQRGRRGGRGRNPNPARAASARGDRSNSNSAASRSRLRASNLRRSARLAQLLNGELEAAAAANTEDEREDQEEEASQALDNNSHQPATNGVMADVARPRPLGNRSARTRHHNGHSTGPSRSGRHSQSPEDIGYIMDMIVQPPQTARAGHPLGGSIIVRLRTSNSNADDAIADSTNLVPSRSLAWLVMATLGLRSIDYSLVVGHCKVWNPYGPLYTRHRSTNAWPNHGRLAPQSEDIQGEVFGCRCRPRRSASRN